MATLLIASSPPLSSATAQEAVSRTPPERITISAFFEIDVAKTPPHILVLLSDRKRKNVTHCYEPVVLTLTRWGMTFKAFVITLEPAYSAGNIRGDQ